jgi:RND family efflux transporter MFP subunit
MKRLLRLVFCTLPLFVAACNDDEKAAGAPPVTVSGPKLQTLTEWDEYTGRFSAVDRVEIRARVSGYLDEIRFTDGQDVKAGDVLFVIDQRPFRIALERAEARRDLAQKEYDRYKRLAQTSASSQQSLDERSQGLRDAKAALEEARLNMEFTEVKSPINGRVSRHLVDQGNLISGGDSGATLLTTVVSDNPIHFYFDASEQELLKYTRLDLEGKRVSSRDEAKPVFVKLQDEQDYVHKGKMDFVDNEIDRSTGSIQGRAILENDDGSLLPGLFGRLRLAGSGEYEAMLVPDEATATNQSQKIVFVVNAEDMVEPRPVVLGPLYEGKWRIVRSGIGPEDRIVWAGLAKVRPGMKVTPKPLEEAATKEASVSESASGEAAKAEKASE